tara:strand:+ start:76353 stop:77216 length:864 start_codon:yes stop_codon:yes gene_type:complete
VEQVLKNKSIYIRCRDYAISSKQYDLLYNEKHDMLITHPQLSAQDIERYYVHDEYDSYITGYKSIYQWAYYYARKLSIKLKVSLVSKFVPEGGFVLDIGSGSGDFPLAVRKRGWSAKGVDSIKKARDVANKSVPDLVMPPSYLAALGAQTFDVITLWHVLEHLPELDSQIRNLKRLIKSEGRIVLACPNFRSYDAKFFCKFWAAYDVPRHLWHFSKNSISSLFQKHGMVVESIHPMWLDSFYISLLSTRNKYGRYKILQAFLVGLISNIKAIFSGQFSSLIYVIRIK